MKSDMTCWILALTLLGSVFIGGCVSREPSKAPTATQLPEKSEPQVQAPAQQQQPQKAEESKKVERQGEKFSIPLPVENSCVGFLIAIPEETAMINAIGAGWARPHPGPFSWGAIEPTQGRYNFYDTDEFVKAAQQNNVATLATVFPFANWDQEGNFSCRVSRDDQFYPRDPRGRIGIPPYRCKPNNMQAYKKFLSDAVERYDGDGENDMPNLKIPIKYWEILNEPELKSPTLTFFIGDENDYVEVLRESYQTIKQACPDCKVLHGGAAGAQTEFLFFWEKVLKAGGGDYFDIANIHHIGMGDTSTLNVKAFKALLDKYGVKKSIWVTEAEFRNQDADVKAAAQGALNAGASKIFFVSFMVGGHGPATPGQHSPKYEEVVQLCPKTP